MEKVEQGEGSGVEGEGWSSEVTFGQSRELRDIRGRGDPSADGLSGEHAGLWSSEEASGLERPDGW